MPGVEAGERFTKEGEMMEETITWKPASDRPDGATTVLVRLAEHPERVWLGYFDHKDDRPNCWRTGDSMRVTVTHWAEMPKGPE